MRRRLLVPLALVLCVAGHVVAHEQRLPLTGKSLLLTTGGSPSHRRFVFRATGPAMALRDPAAAGSAVLVLGTGATGGRTGLIELDPARWRRIGRAGYRYSDRTGARGGVRSVLYRNVRNRGSLAIVAGGRNWPWNVGGKQDSVWVLFRVEDEWYCAEFGGRMRANRRGRVRAAGAPAPAACPAAVCGNGVSEPGEECDDGNLANQDGCTAACASGVCQGQTFASTWEAIEKTIFENGGCTNGACHSPANPAGPAGGLDLTGNPYSRLVRVASTASTFLRVEPGDQDRSYLWLKLAAATLPAQYPNVPGSPMPSGGRPPLGADQLEALRLWIRAGAPETGVVENTGAKLASCLPPPDPQKIPPLDPPPLGTGVQLYAPPWDLPRQSEHEICYPIYYDLDQIPGAVPDGAKVACPPWMGGAGRTCFRYHVSELAQDPHSHHSIIHMYVGAYGTTHPSWGPWTCKGGAAAGMPCDPTRIGVPVALGGADCGPRSACAGAVRESLACVFYGPPDWGLTNRRFGGSQEALDRQEYAPGVYNVIPTKGIVVFNSHAFNLTDRDTTMEQYFNLLFAGAADQLYQVQGIFDDSEIFIQDVPPFESREYCRTFELPQNARLFELSSHTHKRGVLFRIWVPPNAPCTAAGGCKPNAGPPIYVSTEYNDPVKLRFDPPIDLRNTTAESRRYKFCALYDNGERNPATVKRRSQSPPALLGLGGPCAVSETRCIGSPKHNQPCNGSHAFCASSSGDGDCDACPLRGGVTTEDEMLIALGAYYVAP
jgi:cysteine-rich repeat protein